jgi:hypothetical protein
MRAPTPSPIRVYTLKRDARTRKLYIHYIIITASIRVDDDVSTRRYRLQYITRGRPFSTGNIIIRTGRPRTYLYIYMCVFFNNNNIIIL